MTRETVRERLQDVSFTTPVPFTDDCSGIRHDKITETISHIADAGGRTFIPGGNTGEYYSLTDSERFNVIDTTIEAVDDETDDGVVIAGVAGSKLKVIDAIKRYDSMGVDGVMIHGPSHTYIHQRGLSEYYRRIAKSTDLPIVLYKRSSTVSLSVISDVADLENVVGLKFGVNDVNLFSKTIEAVPDDFILTTGAAERFAPAYALEGAQGFTTGVGNFVPSASLALQEALEQKDWSRAREIRNIIQPFEELREGTGPQNSLESANNVPAVKYGLELAGLYGGPVREPLVDLSDDAKARAEEYYEKMSDVRPTSSPTHPSEV